MCWCNNVQLHKTIHVHYVMKGQTKYQLMQMPSVKTMNCDSDVKIILNQYKQWRGNSHNVCVCVCVWERERASDWWWNDNIREFGGSQLLINSGQKITCLWLLASLNVQKLKKTFKSYYNTDKTQACSYDPKLHTNHNGNPVPCQKQGKDATYAPKLNWWWPISSTRRCWAVTVGPTYLLHAAESFLRS